MALTLSIVERSSGVPLTTSVVPSTPSVAKVTGQNLIGVTWSPASGGTPSETIELRTVLDTLVGLFQIQALNITWGDGSPITVVGGFGRSIDHIEAHTYTGSGPYTISVEISMAIPNDIVFTETLGVTPDLSGDYALSQVQVEKYEDNTLRYAPDWANLSQVPVAYQDYNVFRNYQYKYRIRFRSIDSKGAADVVTQFSALATQVAWV